MGLAGRWDLGCVRSLTVTRGFGRSSRQDGVAVYRDEKGCEGSRSDPSVVPIGDAWYSPLRGDVATVVDI